MFKNLQIQKWADICCLNPHGVRLFGGRSLYFLSRKVLIIFGAHLPAA